MPSPTALLVSPAGHTPATLLPAPVVESAPGAAAANRVVAPPTGGLPVLLAGPILRRVDRNSVYVWLAVSAPVGVELQIYHPHSVLADRAGWEELARSTRGHSQTLTLGPRLHLVRVRAVAPTELPRGVVLAYDLSFTAPSGWLFSDVGLLERTDIAYGHALTPTFIVGHPEASRRLDVWHASCRKLHGAGTDAIYQLDQRLRAVHTSTSRPSALLHTGDQIYADDVDMGLLRGILVAAPLLLGWTELVPYAVPTPAHQIASGTGPSTRGRTAHDAGLTVEIAVGASHLLTFGEYAAMYLFAWSPVLWDHPPIRTALGDFNRRMSAVAARRAFANVANYMMWDDHEFTDDWPLTLEMHDDVMARAVGRFIIANAMASAWCFQLWGNADGLGPVGMVNALDAYLTAGRALPAPQPGAQAPSPAFLSTLDGYARATLATNGYGFVAPTTPPIFFLDTRTQRVLARGRAPGLMTPGALAAFASRVAGSGGGPNTPLLVVSPAPVVGFAAAEGHLRPEEGRPIDYAHDPESWAYHPDAFWNLLTTLEDTRRRRVVIFSGDVHYGYMAQAQFNRMRPAGVDIIQLTSSALCNQPEDLAAVGLGAARRLTVERGSGTGLFGRDASGLSYTAGQPRGDWVGRLTFAYQHVRTGATWPALQNNSRVFETNNYGRVMLTWTEAGAMSITHTLEGEQEGLPVTVTFGG